MNVTIINKILAHVLKRESFSWSHFRGPNVNTRFYKTIAITILPSFAFPSFAFPS